MINRYFVICLLSFCAGVTFFACGNALLLISEIIFLVILFILKRRNVFLISIILVLIGAIISSMILDIDSKTLYSFVDASPANGTFQVTDIIYRSDKAVTCRVKVTCIENTNCNENLKLTVYTDEKIHMNGIYNFKEIQIKLCEENEILRYGSSKTFFSASTYKSNIVFKGIAQKGIINKLRNLQSSTNEYLCSLFEKDVSALMCALYTGDTINISPHYKSVFSKMGISHILSVSGFHVVLIMGILDIFLKRFGKLQYIKYLFLMMFVIFTGTSPAIVRAAGMYIFVGLAQIFKTNSDSINSLALIALVSLLINPLLIFDKSFQLSYLATYGVMAVSPIFYLRSGNSVLDFFSKSAATTIAAQIMTLPAILTLNTQFSLVSIAANCLITIFTPFLYATSCLAMILPNKITILLCNTITNFLFKIINIISTSNLFGFQFTNITASIIITSIIATVLFLFSIDRKSRIKRKKIKLLTKKSRENHPAI